MIIREAGILERRGCAFNALMSGLKIPFQQWESSSKMIVANKSKNRQFEEGLKQGFKKITKPKASHQECQS